MVPPGWTPNGIPGTPRVPGFNWQPTQSYIEVEQEHIDVGNNAWVVIALVALWERTGAAPYLSTARAIAQSLRQFKNTSGIYQGFTGGIANFESLPCSPTSPPPCRSLRVWASSEHNLDVLAGSLKLWLNTGDPAVLADGLHAAAFLDSMWDGALGCYRTGTTSPSTWNTDPLQLALDVQTWSILGNPLSAPVTMSLLQCVASNHLLVSNGFLGVDFNTDRDGVWFEGTGQAATALSQIGLPWLAVHFQTSLRVAQMTPPFGDGFGIVASDIEGLTTSFGFHYYRRLHIATAAWNVFAQLGWNPYYQF